jgi:two-component system response regulator (stage 0 sporulation protein F)
MMDEKPLILIVDDESDSLGYLFDLLHNEGFRVLPTSNPLDALDYVARKKPSVIISDVRMPDLDGIELLERVKQIAPKTRVILLTAYGDWALYQDILRKGGDGMLLKPSNNQEILRAVHHALEEVERC